LTICNGKGLGLSESDLLSTHSYARVGVLGGLGYGLSMPFKVEEKDGKTTD